jgi:uncharacterized protein (TIGR02147 family)
MTNIFRYNDYRKFLADYYEEKKRTVQYFSYMNFSRKAGFTSKSFVFNVIKGRKNLSRASVVKLCRLLQLGKTEAAYFENLVYFNQAKNFSERDFYYRQLNAIHHTTSEASSAKQLRKDQYEFYSNWYQVVVRSLIDLYPSVKDPRDLAAMLYPAITQKQAQKSIELLLRLGLIKRQADGSYKVSSKMLTTGKDIQSLAVQRFHLECMDLAANALRELPGGKRNISGITLGISQEAFAKIEQVIISCQEEILDIAEKDKKSDRVFQLNFQFFPVSRVKGERVSK